MPPEELVEVDIKVETAVVDTVVGTDLHLEPITTAVVFACPGILHVPGFQGVTFGDPARTELLANS